MFRDETPGQRWLRDMELVKDPGDFVLPWFVTVTETAKIRYKPCGTIFPNYVLSAQV